jgi:hypothetical protein
VLLSGVDSLCLDLRPCGILDPALKFRPGAREMAERLVHTQYDLMRNAVRSAVLVDVDVGVDVNVDVDVASRESTS